MPDGIPGQDHIFGGGASASILHPAVLVALILAGVLMFVLPRKYLLIPFLTFAFLVPLGQQLVIGGVHWLVLRIVILCGLARLTVIKFSAKGKVLGGGFNNIDKAFLGYVLLQAICFILLYHEMDAINNQFGYLIDFLGGYFLVRALIQDEADLYRALKCLAVITVVLSIGMVREQLTTQNIFGLLGGVNLTPEVRLDKIRSQGAFQHSLTAGVFAAAMLPLFLILWKNAKAKVLAVVGVAGCTVMTICSNSSTPLLTYVAAVFAICLWPIRKQMRQVRWGLVVAIIALHLAMKAPVWFAIAHIDLTGGSSGYHRAELIDQFITHFSDWWLIGTKDAANWGFDLWDQQNQYVSIGEVGGLGAFALFLTLISRACARVGKARRLVEGTKREWMVWFLGASLFAYLVGFFGVNLFDQSRIGWFLVLAMISAAYVSAARVWKSRESQVDEVPVGDTREEMTPALPSGDALALPKIWASR